MTAFVRETLPMLIVGFVFLHISFPSSVERLILFLLSSVLGIWIGAFFDIIIGVLAFWTINLWGLRVLKDAIMSFFSGALVPITLFPQWLETLSTYLPFQSMVFVPVSLYTGILKGKEAYWAIGIQFAWLLGLYLIVRLIWTQAMKRITIFGG